MEVVFTFLNLETYLGTFICVARLLPRVHPQVTTVLQTCKLVRWVFVHLDDSRWPGVGFYGSRDVVIGSMVQINFWCLDILR